MNRKTGKKNKQSIHNKLISGFNSFKYLLTEPVKLILARKKYAASYINVNEKPLISVYIPTYNRAKILMDRAIPSALNQTYRNFELIIVGDSCTDDTEKLLSENTDPRIRFCNLPRRTFRYPPTAENHWLAGPVVPANAALSLVRGKWIARLDDDDTWTNDHLDVLLDFAEKGNYEFVSASYVAERHGNKIIVDAKDENPQIGGTQTWLYRSYLNFFRYNIDCWRKSWNRVNDTDLQDRMFKAGVRMGFLDRVVAYVLPRPGEVTIGLEAYRLNEDEKIRHFAF